MARVFDHAHVLELAKWAEIPVVNGLSDYNHPCQGLADALTIQEKFGRNARGLNISYIGDANNVAVSLMHVSALLGWNFTLASPQGYDLNPKAIEIAPEIAKKTKTKLPFIQHPP